MTEQIGRYLTVHCGIHPTGVNQQTDHSHINGTPPIRHKLLLQNEASLAALSHSIDIYIGKTVSSGPIRSIGEDFSIVAKYGI